MPRPETTRSARTEERESARRGVKGSGGGNSKSKTGKDGIVSITKKRSPTPSTSSSSSSCTAPASDSQSSTNSSSNGATAASPQHSLLQKADRNPHRDSMAKQKDVDPSEKETEANVRPRPARKDSNTSVQSHSRRRGEAPSEEGDQQDPSSNSNDDSNNVISAEPLGNISRPGFPPRRTIAFNMDRNTVVAIPSAKNFTKKEKARCWINDSEFQFTKDDCMRQLEQVHQEFPNPAAVAFDEDDPDAGNNAEQAQNTPTPTPAAQAALRGLELFDPDQCTVRQWNCNEALLAVLEEQDFQRSTGNGTVHARAIKRAYRKSLAHCVRKAYQTAYLDELAVRDYLSSTFDELRAQYTKERQEQQQRMRRTRKAPGRSLSKVLLKPFCICSSSKKDAAAQDAATSPQATRRVQSSDDDDDEDDGSQYYTADDDGP